MSAKAAIFVLCAQALVIQSALSQVCGRSAFAAAPGFGSYGLAGSALNSPFVYNGLTSGLSGNGLVCNELTGNSLVYDNIYTPAVEITPTSGGALPVTSASAFAPNSIVVASENVYEGTLAVGGELPFVGTVGLEGVVPTSGFGAVNHACGNGANRIVSQDGPAVASGFGNGFAPAAAFAPGNIYGGIGAFGNAAAAAPFGYGTGLVGLTYPAGSLAGVYPATGFAGTYPAASYADAYPAAGFASAYPNADFAAGLALYGGAGEGNVAVTGELPVAGTTVVAGQVPIMGAVSFGGNLPAAGAVNIYGKCSCGCGNAYAY